MSDDFEDLFESIENTVEEPVEETVKETEETVTEEPVEETVEAETEVEEAALEAVATEEQKEAKVPLAALHSEREKAKLARARIEELESRVAQFEASKATANRPDPYDDPAGFYEFQEAQIARQVAEQVRLIRVQEAHQKVLEEHGAEAVEALAEWVDEQAALDPTFAARVMATANPAQTAFELKKRHDLVNEVTADPDAWVRRRAQELGLTAAVSAVAETQPTPKKPVGPRSIATVSSRESSMKGSDDFFDDIFK